MTEVASLAMCLKQKKLLTLFFEHFRKTAQSKFRNYRFWRSATASNRCRNSLNAI